MTVPATAEPPPGTTVLDLPAADRRRIDELLGSIQCQRQQRVRPERSGSSAASSVTAHTLPITLRRGVEDFRLSEDSVAMVIRRLAVDDEHLGPTPGHWDVPSGVDRSGREELYLALAASLLGDLFAWSTLQRGRLIMNVLPVRGEEETQTGHGTTLLEWHTEDAFHPFRCDYLALLCLRNPGDVPTQVAGLPATGLSIADQSVLHEPRFYFQPDTEHLRAESSLSDKPPIGWVDSPRPVLFGSATDPYLCVDPIFMRTTIGDATAKRALASLIGALDDNLVDIVLGPGDLLIIDNYRAVHGRAEFTARHDGSDRWLKKAMVTRDLRKSRAMRGGSDGRLVGWSPGVDETSPR